MAALAVFVAISTTATAIPAAALTAPQATPSPPRPATTGQAGAPITLDGVGAGSHTVTLITGDRVRLTGVGGGRFSVDTEPTARPDGSRPTLQTQAGPDGVFVIPDDAAPAVASGRLDRQLFDVKYLAENGYADDKAKQLPVIVQYAASRGAASVKSAAEALPASTPTHQLTSIHGAALNVPKGDAGSFWTTVRGAAPAPGKAAATTLGAGVAKVLLDAKAKSTLDVSVPLIGAPQAWAAGHDGNGVKVAVLDTGVDATHPDLVGKIAASQSFVPGQEVADGHGHGTHVASTIVGSGNASGGSRKGVAKGAQLMVGKVLSNSGSGDLSWIIDGMEWATGNGAKVVSMSIGAGPSDGSDVLSQAVNALTASSGALFVIAAGNDGPDKETILTPGAADAALTVAATDKSDRLADFSSRGPRLGGALKPDIAAPGVDIRAASANNDDNAICRERPDACDADEGDGYMRISGTSMATPHVAGAAAILAQDHPDWKAAQLKAALMSTAKDVGRTVYEQGAGRVDVARADAQQVHATTPNLDFGRTAEPATVSRQLSYVNTGDQPITLTLTPQLRHKDGTAADGALTVDPTVTVPAAGTATVTATLDPADLPNDTYTGAVTAAGSGDIHLTTPVGLLRAPPKHALTVHIIGRNGQPAAPFGCLNVIAVDVPDVGVGPGCSGSEVLAPGKYRYFVESGTYSVAAIVKWVDSDRRLNTALLTDPEVAVTGDTDVFLDARKAKPITFTTDRPTNSAGVGTADGYSRSAGDGKIYSSFGFGADWATPTDTVRKGTFHVHMRMGGKAPEVTMRARTPQPLTLHPRSFYDTAAPTNEFGRIEFVPFSKEPQTLGLVDVGHATPEELEGVNLDGKIALVAGGYPNRIECVVSALQIHDVRAAGAVAVVAYQPPNADPNCAIPTPVAVGPIDPERPDLLVQDVELPLAWITTSEAQTLRGMLDSDEVTLDVAGAVESPYIYRLAPVVSQRIPDQLHYRFTDKELARFDTTYHSPVASPMCELWHTWRPGQTFSATSCRFEPAPLQRTELFGPITKDQVWNGRLLLTVPREGGGFTTVPGVINAPPESFDQPIHTSRHWTSVPAATGAVTATVAKGFGTAFTFCVMCRQGDRLLANHTNTYGDGLTRTQWATEKAPDVQLFQDGRSVNAEPYFGLPAWRLPAEQHEYRLVQNKPGEQSTWTFKSAAPARDELKPGYACIASTMEGSEEPCRPERLIFLRYDLGDSLRPDNTVSASSTGGIRVTAGNPQSSSQLPRIKGLRLWASFDDGTTWSSVPVRDVDNGAFEGNITYPAIKDTTGAVSLKAEAWDADGNRVEQQLNRAVNLRTQ